MQLAANKRTGDPFAYRAALYNQVTTALGRWNAAMSALYDPMRWRGNVPWWRKNPA
ncbi:MAG: hypothetical protein AAF569_09185 [Pseudomonadota bacterium]